MNKKLYLTDNLLMEKYKILFKYYIETLKILSFSFTDFSGNIKIIDVEQNLS